MKPRGHTIQAAKGRPAACAAEAFLSGFAGRATIRRGGKI